MKYAESGSGYSHSVGYTYDDLNNLTKLVETINGTTHTTSYAYDTDNRVTSVTNGSSVKSYTYDGFGRIGSRVSKHGSTTVLTDTITYRSPSSGKTSGQVATLKNAASGYNTTYTYTYDANGNIKTVNDGSYTTTYTYDSQNQLTREDNQRAGKSWTWTYDQAGNIRSKSEYTYTTGTLGSALSTKSYSYDNSWGDLLTGYNGNTVSSDAIGNILSDGKRTYTWEHGRELATVAYNGSTWTNTYDADGMRTARTNGSTAYSYVYNGGSLSQMTVGGNTLYFAYDASGTPLSVTYNGTAYYYVTNLQGDITAILNTSGTAVVTYTYDAWGNILTTGGSMASTLGVHNPLRYRGYVYDTETGLYYLQSRYYDPEMGRFLNADALVATGQGLLGNNMFAYCLNNPVIRRDTSGTEGVCFEIFDDHNPLNDLGNPTGGGGGSSGIWQSFTRTLKYAADGLKMASGQRDLTRSEKHHLISDKHSTKPIECKEIIERYDYSLNSESNIVLLEGHRGRHTNAYHEFITIAILKLDSIADGNTSVFIEGMEILGEFIKQNWWIPYAQYK